MKRYYFILLFIVLVGGCSFFNYKVGNGSMQFQRISVMQKSDASEITINTNGSITTKAVSVDTTTNKLN